MDQVMTGSVELSQLRPELWSAAFYPTLKQSLAFNSSISFDYEGEIRALGRTVNISSFPQFGEAQIIQENQKNDADSVTAAGIDLTINKLIVKDFIVTDVARLQSIDAVNEIRDLAFYSIMKKMQSEIIADTVPSASAPDHQIAYDSGTTLALADILEAKELLDSAEVEDDGSRTMILDSPQWNDIFNITGLTSRDFVDGASMQNGTLPGRVLGFLPKMTTEANGVAYFSHPLFMLGAVQRELQVNAYDQGGQGMRSMRINTSILMGHVQASDVRVVTVG